MSVNKTVEQIIFEGIDRLSQPSKQAQKATGDLRKSLDTVKDALGALGITVGAGAMVALYMSTLKATAALDDMAESTGASVEGLSAIQNVAKVGGHDFEGLTGQIGKMIRGLKDGTVEGGKSAQALRFLGVEALNANGSIRDSSEILVEVAKKLKVFTDDGDKARFIQDALGKGAERYLPLLKDIAEGTDLHAKVTREQAEAAERAEKNINRLKVAMEDARRETVNDLTPAVNRLVESMLAANQVGDGFIRKLQLFFATGSKDDPVERINALEGKLARLREMQASLSGSGLGARFNRMMAPEDLALLGHQIKFAEQELATLRNANARRVAGNAQGLVEDAAGNVVTAPARASLNYRPPDEAGAQRERDFVAKQLQEGLEEEQRIQAEAWHWTAFYADKKLQAEREALQARMQAMMEFHDRGEAAEIEAGEALIQGPSHTMKLLALRMRFDEEFAEHENYRLALDELDRNFNDAELADLAGAYSIKEQMAREHADRLYAIRARNEDQVVTLGKTFRDMDFKNATGHLANMTAGLAAHSKTAFKINQAAGIAHVIMKGIESVQAAYAWGNTWGGPPGGAAMAAIAAVFSAAQVAAIKSQTYGGGGSSAPSLAGTTPALPVTPVESFDSPVPPRAIAAAPAQRLNVTIVGAPGDKITLQQLVEDFIPLMKEAGSLGAFDLNVDFRPA